MTYAAKGYFDALVKMGELASESQGSKELGESQLMLGLAPGLEGTVWGGGNQAERWVCAGARQGAWSDLTSMPCRKDTHYRRSRLSCV